MPYPPETFRCPKPLREVRLHSERASAHTARQLQQTADEHYERGRRDAERALSEQLMQQRAEVLALQQGVLTALRRAAPEAARRGETALLELTLATLEKLLAGAPFSQAAVAAVVREAVAHVEGATEITVLLHPEDLALLERTNESPGLATCSDERLRFQSAPQVTRGGCRLETNFGSLDARLEAKFEQLRQTLLT